MNDAGPSNWHVITPSAFPWEQEALDFIKARFPSHDPYRAWSNFEFVADDGSLNEIDLLVFTRQGFFVVEIKSRPGVLTGDAQTWTWNHDGRRTVVDNPVFLANRKAKRLASLLQRQRALEKVRLPFIEPLIFCSAENLQCDMLGNARFHVCLRDLPDRPGIMAALKTRACPGLPEQPRGVFDRPMAKAIGRALEQIGIRPSQRSRRVGDYELKEAIDEGPGYQDFLGRHVAVDGTVRRIRIYSIQAATSPEQRTTLRRAAEREFHLLQTLEHRGILRAIDFTTHELGPAVIFQHHPDAMRLDHFLVQRKGQITDDLRLNLMRQIAETIHFAHGKHVVHRNLSPRSILVVHPESKTPQTVIMNWQLGYRQASTGDTLVTREVTATVHIDKLAEEPTKVFMAPETLIDFDSLGEHHDIFSLGALCYLLFTGHAPAATPLDLIEKLRVHRGLRVSAVLNGAPEALDQLVQYSTDPDVRERLDSAGEFLAFLDTVEEELTTPSNQLAGDPAQAKTGDILPGGYIVVRKLGTGSTATALLVRNGDREYVAKIAVDADHNSRVRDEGEVLQKLTSPLFVRCHGIVQFADRTAILIDQAGEKTLRKRLSEEGRLSLDLLQRFGEDLLEAVVLLEREGIAHRDIKPDNIGVAFGRDGALHLVLFDFSLSRFSPDNIRAGTPGYLDPFLSLRKPPRWDLHAERYAAGVTLYQMTTGLMPTWHDGKSDPALVDCEVTLEADRFDANLRDQFTRFFKRSLRRNPKSRFDNAQQMLESWREIFSSHTLTGTGTTSEGAEPDNAALLAAATIDTNVAELGLGPAAADALDRLNVLTVRDLLKIWGRKLARMRGVGNKTRKRILAAVKVLRQRLGGTAVGEPLSHIGASTGSDDEELYEGSIPQEKIDIDMLAQRILKAKVKSRSATENTALETLLGLDQRLDIPWPSQGDVAPIVGVTRGRISQILTDATGRWIKDPVITAVRDAVAVLIEQNGGVMSSDEVSECLLASRGSAEDEPLRTRRARVVTRAAVETENLREEPKYLLRRAGKAALIALDVSQADYAVALGQKADEIAREDPLMPPARAIELLRAIPLPPESEPLTDARLIRLAAAASQEAAVSSKQELYPRGMDALRAVKLAIGTLTLGRERPLSPVQITQRVSSRYPEAAPLPGRPDLDRLLADAGLELAWNPDLPGGGGYVSTARSPLSVSDVTTTGPRFNTLVRPGSPGSSGPSTFRPNYVSPEVAEARQFEERLRFAEGHGSFLALTVSQHLHERARQELAGRFAVEPLDLEHAFVDSLRQSATEVGADWNTVVAADAALPTSTDWRNLNYLIASRVIPKIETAILNAGAGRKTVLAYYLNWLQRYGQVVILTRIAQAVQDGRLHGIWLLIPASPQNQMPLLDGEAVPVITNNQWAPIPESWCQNLHRTDIKKNGSNASIAPDSTAERRPTP